MAKFGHLAIGHFGQNGQCSSSSSSILVVVVYCETSIVQLTHCVPIAGHSSSKTEEAIPTYLAVNCYLVQYRFTGTYLVVLHTVCQHPHSGPDRVLHLSNK